MTGHKTIWGPPTLIDRHTRTAIEAWQEALRDERRLRRHPPRDVRPLARALARTRNAETALAKILDAQREATS